MHPATGSEYGRAAQVHILPHGERCEAVAARHVPTCETLLLGQIRRRRLLPFRQQPSSFALRLLRLILCQRALGKSVAASCEGGWRKEKQACCGYHACF